MEAERRIRLAEGLRQCTRGRIEGVPLKRGFSQCARLLGEPKAPISRNHFPALRAFAQSRVRDFRRSLYGEPAKGAKELRLNKDVRLIMVRGGIGLWITRSCSERSRPSACSNGLMCSDAFTAPGSYIIHTGRQRSEEAKRDPGGPSGFARHRAFHSSSCWLPREQGSAAHISSSRSKVFFSPPILHT